MSGAPRGWRLASLAAAALLAICAYVYGLDSTGIASNGDENVYIRIARLTAASGHLLPLQIDMPKFRNTKPPLLFWQAIAATDGGGNWTLWRLRAPSVLYTFATAALLAGLTRRCGGNWHTAVLAGTAYLVFYNTFRYGRPLLTDPPETFWLTTSAAVMLWGMPAALGSAVLLPVLAGLTLGIACLYKSFALILPAVLVLAGWHWQVRRTLALPRLALTALIALAVFGLWFAFDPDPGAIWREFVVGENVGKMGHGAGAYLHDFVLGSGGVPGLLLAMLANGGLLAPVLAALLIDGWRRRGALSPAERWLWIWVIGYFLAFSLPSQRSGRYLLPAMPALAILAALAWPRLHRAGFVVTAALGTVLVLVLALLSGRLTAELPGSLHFPPLYWGLLALAGGCGAAGVLAPRLAADLVLPLAASLLFATGVFVRAYDAPPGPFTPATRAALAHETLWAPCEFAAGEEAHRFMLPGADVRGYRQDETLAPAELARRYRRFAVYLPLGAAATCPGCTLLGERYVLRGRHAANVWRDAVHGGLVRDLFARELVFASSSAPSEAPATGGCGG